MKLLHNRPLLVCSVSFIAALYISGFVSLRIKCIAVLCLIILCLITFLAFYKAQSKAAPVCAFFISVIIAMSVSVGYFDIKTENILSLSGNSAFSKGEILKETGSLSYDHTYEVKLTHVESCNSSFRCELTTHGDAVLNEGDLFEGELTFSEFSEDINGYPERSYKQSKGIILSSYAENIKTTGKSNSPYAFFRRLNRSLVGIFKNQFDSDISSFISCVLLGDRSGISSELKRDFANLGISHMLAISGMHLSIILGFLYILLTALTIDKKLKNLFLIIAALFVTVISGMSVSVVRAGLMTVIGYICYYIGKKADAPSSLCLSCAIICFLNPSSIYDAGLALSFTATFSIVTLGEKIRTDMSKAKIHRRLKRPISNILTAAAVSFSTLPLIYLYFGKMSVVSPVFTLLFTFPLTILLYLSISFIIFVKIPLISYWIILSLKFVTRFFLNAVSFFAKKHIFLISLDYPFVIYIIIAFLVILSVLIIICPKRAAWYALPAAFFVIAYTVCTGIYQNQNENKLFFSLHNSGINDIISYTNANETTLIDITDGNYSPLYAACSAVQKSDYVTHISSYVIVNYHDKNTASLYRLLSAQYVDTVYLPAPTDDNKFLYEELCEIVNDKNVNLVTYKYDVSVNIGNAELLICEPEYIKRSKRPINEIHIKYAGEDIAYLGAAFSETEKETTADYMICGSYGPKYKTEFSYENQNVYIPDTADSCYTGNGETEYDSDIRLILNND